MESRLLAETLMSLAEINNELRNEVINEKYYRENAEKGEKEKSELVQKYKKESFLLQEQIQNWKAKCEALTGEVDDLKLKLQKARKRKK